MYQNKHGRFTAPDPLMASANPANPQTFNRYIYTGNNPVNYTDPSGLVWCGSNGSGGNYSDIQWHGCGCQKDWNPIDTNVNYACTAQVACSVGGKYFTPGQIMVFDNSNQSVRAVNVSIEQSASAQGQSVAQTTTSVAGSNAADIASGSATIGDHVVSALMTIGENNGGNALIYFFDLQPYNEHTELGQAIGNVTTLTQGAAEIIAGLSATGAGMTLTVISSPFCLTGVGCAVPATTVTVSVGGLLTAAHGAGVIGNTIYNMSSNQGPGSRSGNSNATQNSAKGYNEKGRGKIQTAEDAADQARDLREAQKNVQKGKLKKRIDSTKKSDDREIRKAIEEWQNRKK